MLVIDNNGRKKRVSRRDASILQSLGKARIVSESEPAPTPKEPDTDQKDALIEQLASLGIERDRRYGVKKLQAELDEARGGYKTRDMKAE